MKRSHLSRWQISATVAILSSLILLIASAQATTKSSPASSVAPPTANQLKAAGARSPISANQQSLSPSLGTQLRQQQQQIQQVRDNDYQQQQQVQEPINNKINYGNVQLAQPQSAATQIKRTKPQTRNYDQQQEVDHDGKTPINNNSGTGSSDNSAYANSNGGAERGVSPNSVSTEDPLADSEPALYGSVAGAPGVDFPAYTRIPKTSFTCEGKGFDFGFYADEEAQCQVYHICWEGRRESFLCGVGTVFNQAILTCDYWHSVDCSKSSQFWGVNSELGKASAEPAGGNRQASSGGASSTGGNRQQPVSSIQSPSLQSPATIGNQRRTNQYQNGNAQYEDQSSDQLGRSSGSNIQARQQPKYTQQQQQTNINQGPVDDPELNQQQQQQIQQQSEYQNQRAPDSGSFVPQRRLEQVRQPALIQQQQQQQVESSTQSATTDRVPQLQQQQINLIKQANSNSARVASSTPTYATSTPGSQATSSVSNLNDAAKRRVNNPIGADLSQQKVNSLIESPVRAPLNSGSGSAAKAHGQKAAVRAKPPGQLAQRAQQTARKQQATSKRLPLPAQLPALSPPPPLPQQQQQVPASPIMMSQRQIQQQQLQQEQQQYNQAADSEDQQQEQYNTAPPSPRNNQPQQFFDDSPVQTSTNQANLYEQMRTNPLTTPVNAPTQNINQQNQNFEHHLSPANGNGNGRFSNSQQMIIHAGGNSPDGSSAITSQYDTYNGQQELHNYNQPQINQNNEAQTTLGQSHLDSSSLGHSGTSSSSSALADDTGSRISSDDDFRSSGARAAASNKQNWYIMRSI